MKIPALARADACATPVAGGGKVPFDRDQTIG